MGRELLQHLPYSPDLAPSDFHVWIAERITLETLSSRTMTMFYSIVSGNFYMVATKA